MASANSQAVRWKGDDLWLSIVAVPNASKTNVLGLYQAHIKIQISAPATENKANLFLIEWLAKAFDVPKTRVSLEKGHQSRFKLYVIKSPKQLPEWIQGLEPKDTSCDK